jgi:hypothetical protein
MNYLKLSPASIRYLKARLKPFKRPLFWSSLAILTLVGYAIYQYWQHPELLEGSSASSNSANSNKKIVDNSDVKSNLSPDELAVGADLDNVELLLTELEKKQSLTPSTSVDIKAADGKAKVDATLLNQFKDRQANLTKSSKSIVQIQQQNSQPNGTIKNNFLEKPNLTGNSVEKNLSFPTSLSPITNNYLGQKNYYGRSTYGLKKSSQPNYNNLTNPLPLPSNDPFANLNSPSLRNEINSQSQLNSNHNYLNSSPSSSSLPASIYRIPANNNNPNSAQGFPNNYQQPSLNSNIAPSTLNPIRPQVTGNNNPTQNQTGYGYGYVNYGAPPSNLNGDRPNPSGYYNSSSQPNINETGLRSSSLNNVDFNH